VIGRAAVMTSLVAMLVVITACRPPVPADHPSPQRAGDGWICLAEHPLGVFATSCWRTEAECTIVLNNGMAATPACGRYAEAAKTGRPGAKMCVKSDEAACFVLGGARFDRRVVCARTLPMCEEARGWFEDTPQMLDEQIIAEQGGCTDDTEDRRRVLTKVNGMRADLRTAKVLPPGCKVWE
jgi:hypothetical protein